MSHFNEDKDSSPSDPTQKTLSNFIISGDAFGKSGDLSVSSDASDNLSKINTDSDLPINSHEIHCYDSRDPSDSSPISDPNHNKCTLKINSEQTEKSHRTVSNESNDKVCNSSCSCSYGGDIENIFSST